MSLKERRKAKRVDAKLAITVYGGPAETAGQTLNISTNGVYFESPYHIEPLTKVRLTLLIPQKAGQDQEVACDGIVVRVEPEYRDDAVGSYHIAVFFTQFSRASREKLERYIQGRISDR